MNTHQHALIEGLLHHEDERERLAAVVERARHIPPLPDSQRTVNQQVTGCASNVWLVAEIDQGLCSFQSDAESPVVRGLVALLADYFSGATPQEILTPLPDPLDLLRLKNGLSPTRRHGLAAVHATILRFAQAHAPSNHA